MQRTTQSNSWIRRCLATGAILALLVGCGGGPPPDSGNTLAPPVERITITGNDRMRFAPDAFTVKAGSTVTLTFQNIGKMPKATMGHNLVILPPDIALNTFAAASINELENHYIAPRYADRVIASTKVLGPREAEAITFTAPAEPGEYPFVCSFPGHTQAGMVGVMTVVR